MSRGKIIFAFMHIFFSLSLLLAFIKWCGGDKKQDFFVHPLQRKKIGTLGVSEITTGINAEKSNKKKHVKCKAQRKKVIKNLHKRKHFIKKIYYMGTKNRDTYLDIRTVT